MSCASPSPQPWRQSWPPGVPYQIDIPEVGLAQLLRQAARDDPEAKALVFLDQVISYGRLDQLVDRCAAGLAGLGVAKGSVVALQLPNSPQFVVAFMACMRLGAIVTCLNPLFKTQEAVHQLADSGAQVLVMLDLSGPETGPGLAQTAVRHLVSTNITDLLDLSPVKRWLGVKAGRIPWARPLPGVIKFKQLLKHGDGYPEAELDPAADVAAYQYTGGTTGTPKAAMLSHRNLVANAMQCLAWAGQVPPGCGFLGILPLFHIFALTCVMNLALVNRGFMVLFPKPPTDLGEWARAVERWGRDTKIIMPGVPVLFEKINQAKGMDQYDLSGLYLAISGAGPLPAWVQSGFEKLTGCKVIGGYGLSEAGPVTHCNPLGGRRKMGSIGLPLPNTLCRVVDHETGTKVLEAGTEQEGELCIQGPQVMLGYHNRPEETAQVLRDGWLHTGDLAHMDCDGFTFVLDRMKDLIKHKGYSVYPNEVEHSLKQHPDIQDAAVIGLPDRQGGERIKAYVVANPQAGLDQAGVIQWCRQQMVFYKVPSEVEIRDELPKNMIGKVLRRLLRAQELTRQLK